MYQEHDVVVLLHDVTEAGLAAGTRGTIVHPPSRELTTLLVEFFDADDNSLDVHEVPVEAVRPDHGGSV